MRRLIRRFQRLLGYDFVKHSGGISRRKLPRRLSNTAFEQDTLRGIPRHEDREFVIRHYAVDSETGDFLLKESLDALAEEELLRIMATIEDRRFETDQSPPICDNQAHDLVEKIHYGCGSNFFDGWLNVDLKDYRRVHRTHSKKDHRLNYVQMNLTTKHCFPADFFRFGYCEDFVEHLTQADSIIFLAECFRTFRQGGVLRLSFPGLEGVLLKHYRSSGFPGAFAGKVEAFTAWDHLHFYSRDEISLVAKHLGFTKVEFVEYGKSEYPDLCNLDTRESQIGLNTYVELTK